MFALPLGTLEEQLCAVRQESSAAATFLAGATKAGLP
jgi:hypothetical protein